MVESASISLHEAYYIFPKETPKRCLSWSKWKNEISTEGYFSIHDHDYIHFLLYLSRNFSFSNIKNILINIIYLFYFIGNTL